MKIRIGSISLLALLVAAADASAQDDVVRLGRELGGARPPAAYFDAIAQNPNLFRFSPDNGWIRRGLAVAAQRNAGRAGEGVGGVSQRASFVNGVLSGDLNIPVFLVLYQGTDSAAIVGTMPRSLMQDRLFGTDPAPPYTIHTYYREISGDRLLFNGTVLDWKRVLRADTYYEGGCNGLCGAGNVAELIEEIVARHDTTVDYGQFDNDGADGIPNSGDDDGYVDAIVLFHPEVDGACGGVNGSASQNIWAHKSTYAGWTGTDLETLDLAAGGGNIRIRDYMIQGGQGGDGGCTDDQPQAIGVVAHESGHILGLPDLYNTSSLRSSEGIGHWGLMGSGNWRRPFSPAHMEAWSRAELGWVTEVVIGTDTTLTISPVATADTAYVLPIAGTNEYFLFENRQPIGSDAQQHGPGLLVWHVDPTLLASRRAANRVNASDPEALALEQADGLGDLQNGADRGDVGDPFPGSTGNTRFAHNSNPSSARNDGTPTYIVVDSITQVTPGGAVSARIRFAAPTLIAATDTLAAFRLDGTPFNLFDDVLGVGDHDLEMDSVQVTPNGRRRFTWASWSNGQPRVHTFTSTVAGDTITAAVNAEYLLRVSVQGTGGQVSSQPSVDLTGGEFVAQNEVVTLVGESTEPGKVFDGWTGDLISLLDTLLLTMSQPYNLTASFADELIVTAAAPPAAIMGGQYSYRFAATGGNGTLSWQLASGQLPPGLTLLSTGVLSGRPSTRGDFAFDVRARSGAQTVILSIQLTVAAPTLAAADVVTQLVGAGTTLSADEVVFLDFLGNGNGRFDVGDFLAWVNDPEVTITPELMAQALAARKAGQP